jgi:hypothetical protein
MKNLEQLFENNSDCYADTNIFDNHGRFLSEGEVVMAMTKKAFVEVVTQLLSNLYSDKLVSLEKVTRLEVIDGKGRSYVNWNNRNVISLSFQDDFKTLKIFISNENDNSINTL